MNIEMATRLRDYLADPENEDTFAMEQYAQKTTCGTKFCIAGHTVLLSGGSVSFKTSYLTTALGYSLTTNWWFDAEGKPVRVAQHARELLGLTPVQAIELFEGMFYTKGYEDLELEYLTVDDAVKELDYLIAKAS